MALSSSLPVCLYVFHIISLYLIFLMASYDKCFFFDCFPCFFKETHLSTTQSISLFKIFQHSVAVLFFSVLFQSIFAKYSLKSYIFLSEFFCCTLFFSSVLPLLWWYHISGHLHPIIYITTPQWLTYLDIINKLFCELNTMSNTFLLVLTHVEKRNYLVLNWKTLDPLSQYFVEMSRCRKTDVEIQL